MDITNDFLMHHGVEGQKWGHKHGPPYPLDNNPSKQAYKKHKAAHGGESGGKPKTQREIAKEEKAAYKKKKLPKTSLGLLFKNKNLSEAEYREASKKIKRDREVYDGVIHDLYNLERTLNLPGVFLNDGVKAMKNIDYIVGMLTGTSMYDAAKLTASNKRSKKSKLLNEFESIELSDMSDPDHLQHYGVIGMKWGVHKAKRHLKFLIRMRSYDNKKEAKIKYKEQLKEIKDFAKTNKNGKLKVKDIENVAKNKGIKELGQDYNKYYKKHRFNHKMSGIVGRNIYEKKLLNSYKK